MRNKSLFVLLLFLCGCAATTIEKARKDYSAEGIYKAECGICHRPVKPKDYSFTELEAYVKKYTKAISTEEKEALLKFLKENAKE